MNEIFIKQWLIEVGVDELDIPHVLHMCECIEETKKGDIKHGSFVKAVASKDWEHATLIADGVNKKYLNTAYRRFTDIEDEDELIGELNNLPEGYQSCERCGEALPVEDFPHDDSEVCQSCCEMKADMIYEQMRDAQYEN